MRSHPLEHRCYATHGYRSENKHAGAGDGDGGEGEGKSEVVLVSLVGLGWVVCGLG